MSEIKIIKPTGDRILVQELQLPEKLGGIIVTTADRGSTMLPGEVLAVGTRCSVDVEVGQVVYFKRHCGEEIPQLGTRRIINGHDVEMVSDELVDVSTFDRGIGRGV